MYRMEPIVNNSRYYNSSTGRFISEDPAKFNDNDFSLYRYVKNNPYNNIDPDGKYSVKWICASIIAGTAAINTISDVLTIVEILDQGERLSDYFNNQADLYEEKARCEKDSKRRRKLKDLASKFRADAFSSVNDSINESLSYGAKNLPGDLMTAAMSLSCNGVGKIIKRAVNGI